MTKQCERRFIAYDQADAIPNIVVDGAANAATQITLSHWPKSGTPHPLKANSSTEVVFRYLEDPAFQVEATAITNNHFDEDGLVGLYTLLQPEAAKSDRDLLVGIAHAGDYKTYSDRRAARIAFTISAFAVGATSPLDVNIFALPYAEKAAALYRELLPRLGTILRDTDKFRRYWEPEDQRLSDSETRLSRGAIQIDERPELDLAVVTILEGEGDEADAAYLGCHRMAIHNATARNRLLIRRGRRYVFAYRYESWVQMVTRRPLPRVDLTPLAEALSAEEPGAAAWTFDGVAEITPRMTLAGAQECAVSPAAFLDRVSAYLGSAAPAWDPYDPQ